MQYICNMPMVHQFCDDNNNYSLGLWKIEEGAGFFMERIPYAPSATHLEKQVQQLASRMVLDCLSPPFPFHQVELGTSGKPTLSESGLHFSLSHCRGFAAGIVSTGGPVGIDVEVISDRVLKIEKKFLNQQELQWLEGMDPAGRVAYSTLLWSIKETVFKWWGSGGLDFSRHICVQNIDASKPGMARVDFLLEDKVQLLEVQFLRMENAWLSFLHMDPIQRV